ncbi:hypothetical protein FQR65_LT01016 [Abscondita terminalis]|nr:hypothetical protein FQR65_LT01016 [Abscondita terminalis]
MPTSKRVLASGIEAEGLPSCLWCIREYRMHQYSILVASMGVLVALLTSSVAMHVETCSSDASPKMRQLCLLASLEQLLAETPSHSYDEPLDTQLYDRGSKRQDVDHVFLRFGRRLGL